MNPKSATQQPYQKFDYPVDPHLNLKQSLTNWSMNMALIWAKTTTEKFPEWPRDQDAMLIQKNKSPNLKMRIDQGRLITNRSINHCLI